METPPRAMIKSRIFMLIQTAVSIGLIGYLLSRIDLSNSVESILNAKPWLLAAGLAQMAIQPILGALRWKLILRSLGASLRFGPALRFVWIGTFFSQALPGAVGGDAVRIWLYWKSGAGHRAAINSVIIERIIMVLGLLSLVTALQPGLAARNPSPMVGWLPALMLSIGIGGTAALMLSDRLVKRFDRWLPFRAITHIAADLRMALLHPATFVAITAISILAYLNMAVTAWLIALALGLSVTLIDCIVLIPLVLLISTIPVSVGGWGLREGAMVVLMAGIGVSAPGALGLSVLFGIAGILVSLPGAAIWLSSGHRRADLSEAAPLAVDRKQVTP